MELNIIRYYKNNKKQTYFHVAPADVSRSHRRSPQIAAGPQIAVE